MATYKKTKIMAGVQTLMGGQFSGGTNTFEAFNAHKTIEAEAEGGKIFVPFHAVKRFESAVITEEVTKADAYCK